jgi:hypothetical protein
MTRNREIELKAEQNTTNQLELEGYIKGANYADQHPRKGLWDANKVIKWLQDNADSYTWYDEFKGESGMIDDFIEDLRKAMEE